MVADANAPQTAVGFLETTGFTPALVATDRMDKTAGIRVVQAEINDFLGICIKITGSAAAVEAALRAGYEEAVRMHGKPITRVVRRPDSKAWATIASGPEFNPLIQQDVVHFPDLQLVHERQTVASTRPNALGFIETQGFTAVFDAIDTACKAANVNVVGKEKLGGGYVTVVIEGDVAAVRAAVDAGAERVEALGKLIAAHVIARPSESVWCLLPR